MFTDDLKDERRFVLKVLHLHTHLIRSGVFSLSRTDEQDAVSICAADVNPLFVQWLPVLCPAHYRFGFALRQKKTEDKEEILEGNVRLWHKNLASLDLP